MASEIPTTDLYQKERAANPIILFRGTAGEHGRKAEEEGLRLNSGHYHLHRVKTLQYTFPQVELLP